MVRNTQVKTKSLSSLFLYPNPAQTAINVQGLESFMNGTLQLLDASGRILFSTEIDNAQFNLSLEEYARGIYFVQFQKGKQNISKKLMLH